MASPPPENSSAVSPPPLPAPPAPSAPEIALVLLPGLDGTGIFFEPLLAALPPWIRPVVVTYPATGPNRYADLLAHIRRTVADLPDFVVLGWSFSGPLALLLAAAEPGRVRAVILSATFVRPPRPWLPWLRFALVGPVVASWRVARRLPLWLLRPPSDAWREAKTRTWRSVPASLLARRLRAIAAVDVRAPLRACPVPVLHLAASHDRIVPGHNVAAIRRENPAVAVVTLPGPHLAMFTAPRAAAAAVADFLAALPARSPR